MNIPAKNDSPLADISASQSLVRDQVEFILETAKRLGASAAEVSVSQDVGLSVTARMGELETVEFNQDRGFGVTVYVDDRKGVSSTSDISSEAVTDTVKAALNIAKYTQGDPCSGLADADKLATDIPELDVFHPWEINAKDATKLALDCESQAMGMDKRINNSDGATLASHQSCRAYGNSNGFLGSYLSSRHSLAIAVIATDAAGMQKDYWYTVSRRAEDLENAQDVGQEAARRAVARLGSRSFAPGRMPVLFSPQMSTGLIGSLLSALAGGALYRNMSFLTESMGTKVAQQDLSIVEYPLLQRAMGSAGFDGDGVATSSKAFIKNGIVNSYILSTYSARRLSLESTGNAGGVHNVSIEGALSSLSKLLKQMGTGVMVTQLMGQGVNAVTGDYSRGASGFWIENGEIAYPIENFTIASNLKDMFLGVAGLGTDVDLRGNIRSGSILVDEMTVATG
ncbi:MAG: metalloprotease PmbA [Pseudomonadales bacterium]|nr:metalloprotease PmbA [Pseudomonadales bacterium]